MLLNTEPSQNDIECVPMLSGTNAVGKSAWPSNAILTAAAVFSTLTWVHYFYYYVWTGQRQFTSAVSIVVDLLVTGLVSIGLFWSLRLRPSYKLYIATCCVALVISVYGTELFLRISRRLISNFDTRTRLEVILDLRKQGIDAVPSVSPAALLQTGTDGVSRSGISIQGAEVLPLAGVGGKTTVMCNESGEYLIYKSDFHGFHNPEYVWNSPTTSIAAVGDSFTHGVCVPSDKNFVALIRKTHPTTLNLGTDGAGPLVDLAVVKEYLRFIRPKVVLWFYFEGNDFRDLARERRLPLLRRYLESDFNQDLIARQTEIDTALSNYIDSKRKLAEMDLARGEQKYRLLLEEVIHLGALRRQLGLADGAFKDDESATPEEWNIRLFREILENARNFIQSWNGRLYFVYLPSWDRYARPRFSDQREAISALASALGLPMIDIDDSFRAHGNPLSNFPYRDDYHYNESGHRLVGETVLNVLSQH
jgi:lysophospholipase L1-like esterase